MGTDDFEDYELVDGELVALCRHDADHSLIKDFLIAEFRAYLKDRPIGVMLSEIDCELSKTMVRRPDISFFLERAGRSIPRRQVPIPFAPDIAIEILSPSEGAMDVNRKILDYQRAGCQEVWVLDQENGEIFVHAKDSLRLLRESDKLSSPLLPGLELAVGEILNQ